MIDSTVTLILILSAFYLVWLCVKCWLNYFERREK
jgi:threonine/homoserine/homoserine lactone efflux protein